MNDLAGRNLGPYRLLEQVGGGGMATVYKAYHAAMDRYVAIKVLPPHLARDPNFRARFEREVRTIARLEHRYILPVHDVAENDGIPYLVMRYTDSGDLSSLIAAKQLTIARTIELVAQVAEALAHAHRQGVIHRDVKPANVLIGREGDALLADFGIAKIYEDTLQLTGEGHMVGTPAYMAPEQLQGKPVDARTDIYALGVVLYQALTGECPFIAETPLAVAMMHIHNPLRPPRQLNPAIPEAIERIMLRALAKNPVDRFQSAGEMADALRQSLHERAATPPAPALSPAPSSAPTPALTPVVPQPTVAGDATPATATPPPALPTASAPPRTGRRGWLVLATVAAVMLLAGLAYFLTRGQLDSGTAPAPASVETAAGASAGAVATSVLAADVRQALDSAVGQLDQGDGGAALETLKPALEAHPDDPTLLAARGIAEAIYSGNDLARATIERALSLDRNNALAHFARGFLNAKTDKPDEAIADYTRAIELDPSFGRAYFQRSRVLSDPKMDFVGARRDLDRAIELTPDLIAARMSRAYTLYYVSDLEAALADLDHVLSLEPKYSEALYLRAQAYEQLDRIDDARRDFDAAAAAAPDDTDIFRERAAFFIRHDDYAAALADADKLIALDGAEPRWQVLRGFTLHALDRNEDALGAFDQALLIGGNEVWAARYGRGRALLAQDRAQDALGDLEAAQAHPDDTKEVSELFYGTGAMPLVDLARAYQALGQTDKALQALDAALQQDESFVAFLERGRARAAAGNRDGAREDLQSALRRAVEAKDDQQRALVEAELKKIQ